MTEDSFSVRLGPITLEHPIMNAAGTCKLVEDVEKLAPSAVAAILVGSITVEDRAGNSGNTYQFDPRRGLYSLNSLGLPNPGKKYYHKCLPEMVAMAHKAGKPLILSGAGFTPAEYAELALLARDGGADLFEANLGCPNVWDGGKQKRIASFSPYLVAEILRTVSDAVGNDIPLAVKVSPFSDPYLLAEIAGVVLTSPILCVTAVNTFPNAFGFSERGERLITPAEGLAGLGGPALKPIGLGQVKQWRSLLPPHMHLIGAGGISNGKDVWEYLRVGATAVQVATMYLERGEAVFSTLLQEFAECT